MKIFSFLFLIVIAAPAQSQTANPQLASSKAFYEQVKGNVLKSVDKMPEEKFSFKPSTDVRSYGQVLAHIADGQYVLCGVVKEGKPQFKGNEKSATTKTAIVKALNDGFAYCDAVYTSLTDASSAEMV